MNTAYGRYGMSPYLENYSIINKNDLDESINYLDSVDLGDNEMISMRRVMNVKNSNFMLNISTSIASAVTAYSRIEINKLKLQFKKLIIFRYRFIVY